MPDDLKVAEAAQILGTSGTTVRTYLRQQVLDGRRDPRTGAWLVRWESIESFIAAYGRLNGGRRRKSQIAVLEADVLRLTGKVARLTSAAGAGDAEMIAILDERDDLRARVVVLEDALARMRNAAELQRQAEAERADMVSQLLAALGSADRADRLRRQALESLEDALAGGAMPGHPGSTS